MSYDYTLITNTDDVALDPISQMVQEIYQAQAVLSLSVLQGSHEVGADSASYPRAAGFTAEAVPTDSNGLSAQAIDWAVDKLEFDKDYAVLVDAKWRAMDHSVINQQAEIMKRQTLALVKQMEVSVYAALAAVSASGPDHKVPFATSGVIALSDILGGIKLLDDQELPDDGRFIAVNQKQYSQLLALGDFIDASKYGSNQPVMNGEIGMIYGLRVLKTPRVTADTALVYHRDHVVFAMDKQMAFDEDKDLVKVTRRMLMTARWGVKTLDAGKRGVLLNNSGS